MVDHAFTTELTRLSGFQHHFETVRGVRLHFVECGNPQGDTLVLLAGYPESWYSWRKVMPLLAEKFRLIAIDLPGQGDSDKPTDGYDTETVARYVHGLLSQRGITHYGLVAHDVGAWVAFPYAAMYQNELSGLVLMDAGIPGITLPEMLPAAPDRSWKTWHFSFHMLPDLPEALIAGKERVYLDWFLRRKTASPFSFSEEDLDEYERIFTLPGALRAGLAFYRSAAHSAEQNKALAAGGKLTVPLLALSADQGSIPDMSVPLSPFFANVAGKTINRCGHFIQEEQPVAAAAEIKTFFTP
ncbi:alpha/beta fold hydrolase [Erwinia tasmaniensis]|uniref:alpha/beta fold hydrolase n=1 Tax=Erwinia tasmaniensis TaxID=338565 RepID=UPI003A4DC5BE